MARNVDLRCSACGREEANVLLAVEETVECVDCKHAMDQIWWGRPRGPAQWDDSTAVMVHVHPGTGEVRYVGSHDAKLKPGFERQYLRSLREVERFEKSHGVQSEMAWYDKGSGRGFDDEYRGRKLTH